MESDWIMPECLYRDRTWLLMRKEREGRLNETLCVLLRSLIFKIGVQFWKIETVKNEEDREARLVVENKTWQ